METVFFFLMKCIHATHVIENDRDGPVVTKINEIMNY